MEDESLFNPEDFKSVEVIIVLNNETTQTKVMDGKRIYGEKVQAISDANNDLSIKLSEFTKKGLLLEIPSKSCAEGHTVLLQIQTQGAKHDMNLDVSGKVHKVKSLTPMRDSIEVELQDYDQAMWNAFKGIFSNRQDEITEFFKAVKGY